MNNDNIASEEDFESLLEASLSGMSRFEPGESIETEIVSIVGETLFLQLGGKSEGVLQASELKDKEGNLSVKVGEPITAFFLAAKNGEMLFTTKISGEKAGRAVLENAFQNEIPIQGTVEKEVKGGFEVKIGDSHAFCPYSQMGKREAEDPKKLLSKQITFKIIEIKENGRNILVSNRAILEDEHKQKIASLKQTLKPKMVVKGEIKSIRDFGAFVEIFGIQALLPISEISRTRVENINSILKVGQEIDAVVLNVDWARERISVSMKALESNPWDCVASKYPVGSKHTGEVVRVENYGAFISLEPGLDGLIHISDLAKDSRDNNPNDIVKKGEKIKIVVNSFDLEKKRISLKPVDDYEADEAYQSYSQDDVETDIYNPFALLLKK